MKLFLLFLALSLLVSFFYLNMLGRRCRNCAEEVIRLVIMVKDQEPWVEGFIRKLFRIAGEMPYLDILVIDGGSSDRTRDVLARLQGSYPFKLALAGAEDFAATVAGEHPAGGYFFDVRGLTGSALLNAPLFSRLKALNRR